MAVDSSSFIFLLVSKRAIRASFCGRIALLNCFVFIVLLPPREDTTGYFQSWTLDNRGRNT